MRVGRWLFRLLVAAFFVVGATWLTAKREFVLREGAVAEWTALVLAHDALAKGQHPDKADAALFLSNAVLDRALNQLVGATVDHLAGPASDFRITVEGVRVESGLGLPIVRLDLDVASRQFGTSVKLATEGTLAFRGVASRERAGDEPVAVAQFEVILQRVEPRFALGFLDLPGRYDLSKILASGVLIALGQNLVASIPIEDQLNLNVGFAEESSIKTDAGTVTLQSTLPKRVLKRRFGLMTPLFIRSGVWLSASLSARGQEPTPLPRRPDLSLDAIRAQTVALRGALLDATEDLEQTHDLVLSIKGRTLAGLVDQLGELPIGSRTVTIRSIGTTGQLISNGKSYAELQDPTSATARLVIGPPNARWVPDRGVSVATDLAADLQAKVHAHLNVLPVGGGNGTTVLLEGGAAKHITGTLALEKQTIDGHAVLSLGASLPCETVTAEIKTDGKIKVGPVKTDIFSVGLRWTVPLPAALGRPNLIWDDLPRRFELTPPKAVEGGPRVALAHSAVEYAIGVTDVQADEHGYRVTANLAMHAADSLRLPADVADRRADIVRELQAADRTGCPSVAPDMKVLIGDIEIGSNGELAKFVDNAIKDLTQGPGPHNDLVGSEGFVPRTVVNAVRDVVKGPGQSNDLVGRKGWVRKRLGF